MTSRSGRDKEHGVQPIEDFFAETNVSETDEFLPGDAVHTPRFLPRGLKSMCISIKIAARALFINNRVARLILGIVRTINVTMLIICRIFAKIIPPDMAIHVCAAILVTVGTLTLFVSPMFRSKLSEMRERPISMQNGIIDAMAWSSDQYAVVYDTAPPRNCLERYFRCEYYWASDTSDATDKRHTAYCSAYVCKGMTVTVSVLPQSCSTSNRVAIGALLQEIYAKPVYSCGNSGCGVCSTLRYHSSEDGEVSLLQGCDDELSCYGQVEVSITWDRPLTATAATSLKIKSKAPWQGFRGGQLSQGTSRFRSKIGTGVSLKWEIMGGAFISSPAISSSGVAYVGCDDHNLYAFKSNGKGVTKGAIIWKFLTLGKVQSSPMLSLNEKVLYIGSSDHYLYSLDSQSGVLSWKFLTGGEILSSPSIGIDPLTLTSGVNIDSPGVLYVGSNDGYLYAISSTGKLRWRFSTAITSLTGLGPGSGIAVLGPIKSSPSISPDDNIIYFGCDNGHLYAITNLGKLKWSYKVDGIIISSPAISSDGLSIYFGSNDHHFYALSSSGVLKWRYNANSPMSSSPALFEGILYFGSMSKIHINENNNKNFNSKEIDINIKQKKIKTPLQATRNLHENKNHGGRREYDNLPVRNRNSSNVNHNIDDNDNNINNNNRNISNNDDNNFKYRHLNNVPLSSIPPVKNQKINKNDKKKEVSPIDHDDSGSLFAITIQGELLWKLNIPKGTVSSPLIGADGTIYIGTEDASLLSINQDGNVRWMYKANGPISSSPGVDADGSIYIGTSNHDEVVSSVGTIPGNSGNGRLTVVSAATLAAPVGNPITPINLIPDKVQVSQNSSIPSIVKVPIDKSWYCSAESLDLSNANRGVSIDQLCTSAKNKNIDMRINNIGNRRNLRDINDLNGKVNNNNNNNDNSNSNNNSSNNKVKKNKKSNSPAHICLPGLADYIGKGVDITLQNTDPKFRTRRIFDFNNINKKVILHGREYFAPSERLSITELDEIEISNPLYSYAFTGVRTYTLKQSQAYNISSHFLTGNIPTETVSSIVANSTGTWTSIPGTSMANMISNNIKNKKITLLNVASYKNSKYDILPQTKIGQKCTLPFVQDTENLPKKFDELHYLSYIKRFGTHVIIGATYGGTVSALSAYDPCNAMKNNRNFGPGEIFDKFKKDLGDFIVYGKQTEISFLSQIIHRDSLVVCGGDKSVFLTDSKDAFTNWSKSTIFNENKLCVVSLQLIPIYATIPPENVRRKEIEAAVLDYMTKAKNFVSHNLTEISTCKNKK